MPIKIGRPEHWGWQVAVGAVGAVVLSALLFFTGVLVATLFFKEFQQLHFFFRESWIAGIERPRAGSQKKRKTSQILSFTRRLGISESPPRLSWSPSGPYVFTPASSYSRSSWAGSFRYSKLPIEVSGIQQGVLPEPVPLLQLEPCIPVPQTWGLCNLKSTCNGHSCLLGVLEQSPGGTRTGLTLVYHGFWHFRVLAKKKSKIIPGSAIFPEEYGPKKVLNPGFFLAENAILSPLKRKSQNETKANPYFYRLKVPWRAKSLPKPPKTRFPRKKNPPF